MAIFSIFKGGKAADKTTSTMQEQQQPPPPRPEIKRNWTSENMTQLNRSTSMEPITRTTSEISVRSYRQRLSRTSTSPAQDWIYPSPSKQRPASLRPMGRNSSFQGLAQVLEDGHALPPLPPLPARYSTGSSSKSTRPKSSRSPSSVGSSLGKSPLSSAETTPVDSEDSSNASTKSEDILEMRSHPFSTHEQFVFQKSQDVSYIGKGKAPIDPIGQTLVTHNENYDQRQEAVPMFDAPPERKYFTKSTPTGGPVSEMAIKTAESAPAPVKDSPIKQEKKKRFSFMRKGGSAVAAH